MSDPTRTADAAAELDILRAARAWLETDGKVVLATVVDTWGSAPVGVGSQMVIGADGRFQGSVSGGCVEGEVIAEAEEIIESGKPKTLPFGVADETAWRVGLPCGGQIRVFLERLEKDQDAFLLDRALAAREGRRGLVVRTRLTDGNREVFERNSPDLEPAIAERFVSGECSLEETASGEVFLNALLPSARILIIGATHIGQVLAELVKLAGYEVTVIDPRTAFAAERRFPGIKLITAWPQDVIPELGLDPYTAVVALSHVGHIDDEALKLALRTDCLYIGALGSQRNHAKRTERLKSAGFADTEIKRIHCPIGLNIGAQSPAEIAIAIMAELVLALRGEKQFKPA
jgi:xanthine dehydrogenase accessory factor